jgi:hypothetical protein
MDRIAPITNARTTEEVAMSKTTTNTNRTEDIALGLFETAMSIYSDDMMTSKQHKRLTRILKALEELGYSAEDVVDSLHEASLAA